MYPLWKAKKGKALIISNSSFEVDWLKGLDGYHNDKTQLTMLWLKLGFEVYYASCADGDAALRAEVGRLTSYW